MNCLVCYEWCVVNSFSVKFSFSGSVGIHFNQNDLLFLSVLVIFSASVVVVSYSLTILNRLWFVCERRGNDCKLVKTKVSELPWFLSVPLPQLFAVSGFLHLGFLTEILICFASWVVGLLFKVLLTFICYFWLMVDLSVLDFYRAMFLYNWVSCFWSVELNFDLFQFSA